MAVTNTKKRVEERNTFGVDEKLETEFNFSHLKRSLVYVKKYFFKMLIALVFALFATVFTLLGPKIISLAIDNGMTESGSHYGEVRYIILLGTAYLLSLILSVALTAVR